MTPAPILTLSPRVLLYSAGSRPAQIPEGTIALAQVPGRAFGDGSHPTTRLCAGAVDLLCRQKQPVSVLDVGTGTGILARIARDRGAQFVVGTDIDPVALDAARANAALDAHPVNILIADASPESWGPRFDLVVANILEGPLRKLAGELANSLAPDGVLLISGFTRLQIPPLRVAFTNLRLTYVNESSLDEWALLLFRR